MPSILRRFPYALFPSVLLLALSALPALFLGAGEGTLYGLAGASLQTTVALCLALVFSREALRQQLVRKDWLELAFALTALLVWALVFARIQAPVGSVFSAMASNLAVLWIALRVGSSVGLRLQSLGHLPAVVCASSAADLWSVSSTAGPTHALVASGDTGLQRLVALSTSVLPELVPQALLGGGDVLFAGLYLSAVQQHKASALRAILGIGLGTVLAMALSLLLARPLPALPAIGLCVLVCVPESLRVPRKDWAATALGVVLLALALWRTRSM